MLFPGMGLVVFVMMSSFAWAQESEHRENSQLHIGGSYSVLWLYPEGETSFRDGLYGMQGVYEYQPLNAFYAGIKFSWKQGAMHAHPDTRFLLNFDVHERIGYTFSPCNHNWHITGFTGFGYQYLGYKFSQPMQETLRLLYHEFYVPLGVLVGYHFTSVLQMGLNFIWMPQVFPSVDIIPNGGAYWIIQRTFTNFLVEIPVSYSVSSSDRKWRIEFKPFFQYWRDGRPVAETSAGVSIPFKENNYLFVGSELDIAWTF